MDRQLVVEAIPLDPPGFLHSRGYFRYRVRQRGAWLERLAAQEREQETAEPGPHVSVRVRLEPQEAT